MPALTPFTWVSAPRGTKRRPDNNNILPELKRPKYPTKSGLSTVIGVSLHVSTVHHRSQLVLFPSSTAHTLPSRTSQPKNRTHGNHDDEDRTRCEFRISNHTLAVQWLT